MPVGELTDEDLTIVHEALCYARNNNEDFTEFMRQRDAGKERGHVRRWIDGGKQSGHDLIGRVYRVSKALSAGRSDE